MVFTSSICALCSSRQEPILELPPTSDLWLVLFQMQTNLLPLNYVSAPVLKLNIIAHFAPSLKVQLELYTTAAITSELNTISGDFLR